MEDLIDEEDRTGDKVLEKALKSHCGLCLQDSELKRMCREAKQQLRRKVADGDAHCYNSWHLHVMSWCCSTVVRHTQVPGTDM